jgi:hypothetical protein
VQPKIAIVKSLLPQTGFKFHVPVASFDRKEWLKNKMNVQNSTQPPQIPPMAEKFRVNLGMMVSGRRIHSSKRTMGKQEGSSTGKALRRTLRNWIPRSQSHRNWIPRSLHYQLETVETNNKLSLRVNCNSPFNSRLFNRLNRRAEFASKP